MTSEKATPAAAEPKPKETAALVRRSWRFWLESSCWMLLGWVCLLATLSEYGLAIDEASYVFVVRELRLWEQETTSLTWVEAFSPEQLSQRWHFLEPPNSRAGHSNFNLPGSHYLMWLGWQLAGSWLQELTAYRLGSVLLLGWTLGVVCRTIANRYGRLAAHGVTLLLLCQPRLFGHAHLAATETTLVCLWLITVCFINSGWQNVLRPSSAPVVAKTTDSIRWRWIWSFLLLLGVTMTTKLTGWLLLPALLAWLLWCRPSGWWWVGLLSVTIPFLIVYLLTPPLWFDPLGGFIELLRTTAQNPWKIKAFHRGVVSEGGMIGWPVFEILFATVPITTLLLSSLGALWLRHDSFIRLLILNLAVLLILRAIGKMPEHDGERQFIPVYGLLPLLTAPVWHYLERQLAKIKNYRLFWSSIVLFILLFEPIYETWQYRNSGLMYYNQWVGGLTGATARGYEVSYWYERLDRRAWQHLLGPLPAGTKVWLFPDHPGQTYLQEWDIIPNHIEIVGAPETADYWLLYAKRAYLALGLWEQFAQTKPEREIRQHKQRIAGIWRYR